MLESETWNRFDFGLAKNMDKYGQAKPPAVPIEKLSIPTGLFVGEYDKLATVGDSVWLKDHLSEDTLVWYKTYPLDHLSFSLAYDMSFFTTDAMALVNQYATNSFAESEEILLN